MNVSRYVRRAGAFLALAASSALAQAPPMQVGQSVWVKFFASGDTAETKVARGVATWKKCGPKLVWGKFYTGPDSARLTPIGGDSLAISVPCAVVSPTVASLSATLATNTLAPGQTTIAKAIAKDSTGATLSRVVAWASTNQSIAVVSDSGLVTAISAGTSDIRATVDTKSSVATLSVVAPVPPRDTTPPPPPSPGHPNEPSGFVQLSPTLSGDTLPLTSYGASVPYELGWLKQNGVIQATDAASPVGTSKVLEIDFPAGMVGGGSPGGVFTASSTNPQNWPQHPRALYQSYWYKVSPNFPANLVGNKMVYSNIGGGNKVYTSFGGGADYRFVSGTSGPVVFDPGHATAYTTPLFLSVDIQGVIQVDGSFQSSFNLNQNVITSDPTLWKHLVRGQWHHIETLYTANTAGIRDGGVKAWIDGVLVIDFTNRIQWSATADLWQWTTWLPVYGGGGQVPTNAVNAYHRLKDFYVSGPASSARQIPIKKP